MNKINMDDPIHKSLIYLAISFVFFIIIIGTAKPYWIQNRDIHGDDYVCYKLLFSFSLTFSLVVAITVLLLSSKTQSISFQPN